MAIQSAGFPPAGTAGAAFAPALREEQAPTPAQQQAAEQSAMLAMLEEYNRPGREDRQDFSTGTDFESMYYTAPGQKNRFAGIGTSKPKDSAPGLTSRLVSASSEMQVGTVISEANTAMMGLRMVAALGKGEDAEKAKAYLRKLEKLVARARGKINQLKKEEILRGRHKKAEQNRQQKKAEKLKQELRKKASTRATRENAWLLDTHKTDYVTPGHMRPPLPFGGNRPRRPGPPGPNNSHETQLLSEAEITRLAEAMAAEEAAGPAGSGGAETGGMETLPAGPAAQAAGFSGTAASEGGEAAAGGSLDVIA